MLDIKWSKTIVPDLNTEAKDLSYDIYDGKLTIENTRKIEKTEKEIVTLPDRRAYRSMSRSSVLLSAAALGAKDFLDPYLKEDPFSVGIYCAIKHGPEEYNCSKELIDVDPAEFAIRYKKLRNPKHYLKQLPNLAPSQLSIFLEIMGPANTYDHSINASYHAMAQAEFDINTGKVKAALICGAFSLEDPLLSRKVKSDAPNAILTEGGAAVLMTSGTSKKSFLDDLEKYNNKSGSDYFGIVNPLLQFVQKEL